MIYNRRGERVFLIASCRRSVTLRGFVRVITITVNKKRVRKYRLRDLEADGGLTEIIDVLDFLDKRFR